MKKVFSLIKACMTEGMSIFKIKNKNSSKISKKLLPIVLAILVFFSIWSYANMFMEELVKVHLEFVLLTLFILFTTIFTLVEGIYKASNLLFNSNDDNLLLSLPIKRSTVLFIRVFKFYVFELLFNSLFLIPAMVVYVRYVSVGVTFYISSIIALLVFPIIPIVISCIIGAIISSASSKFRFKNLVQIIITTIFLLVIFYISFNLEKIIMNIAENAKSINDLITKLYYPAGAYIGLVTDFNIKDLVIFILSHLTIFIVMIFALSKVYFKINSKVKGVKTKSNTKDSKYKIKTRKPMKALIVKEFNKFISSPVFVINAGFGLVLFVVGCILICVKLDSVITSMQTSGIGITAEQVKLYIPAVLFGLVCMASLMSSITSSMISLEYKSFNILKSLPVSSFKIIIAKVLTATIVVIPFILIGDLILFVNFKFTIIQMVLIIFSSFILPIFAEALGIIINLKYPKLDAENDTEVVKQSMSSAVAVFAGIIFLAITGYGIYKLINMNMSIDLVILIGTSLYFIFDIVLLIYLKKRGVKKFNNINV